MKTKLKSNIFSLLLVFVNTIYSQELKIIDTYGNPVKSKTIILNNTYSDTLKTNNRGKIKIHKNTDYQSVTILEYNTIVPKDSIRNGILQITSRGVDALPTFETKTTNHSNILNSLKEFDHETITKEKILNSDYSTSADILLLTDGVTIQKSQGGGGSPIIRGFEANRILLMIDGVRMNNAIYRNGHVQNSLTVDPFIIEDFNVIYGPSAVTYGSDAIGGVINYTTIKPKLSNKKDTTLEKIRLITRLNKGADELTNHIDFNFSQQRWASFSSLTFKQFGDIVMGGNRRHGYADWGKLPYYVDHVLGSDSLIENPNPNNQLDIGYNQIDITQKFLFKPTQHLEISTNSQLSTSSNIQRFDQLNNY
ncbi:MAG: TonB-dependent receptor, partial [Bacteroidota bacterium]|nr:TonB-dependent receptor [Bacteroidota bacterium]